MDTDTTIQNQRDPQDVLADAIAVLTDAARLHRPVLHQGADGHWQPHPTQTEPADWAEFVSLAVAGAAANVGDIDKALQGRPGSWEAERVRELLTSTVGYYGERLLEHRTEPIHVDLWPEQVLADLGYDALYEESRQALHAAQQRHVWRYQLQADDTWLPLDEGAPAIPEQESAVIASACRHFSGAIWQVPRRPEDEEALDRLLGQEEALDALMEVQDPQAYGEAIRRTIAAKAAELFPGAAIEVQIHTGLPEDATAEGLFGGPEEQLLEAAVSQTPLPWSGTAPKDYPLGQSIADVERTAARLPHHRLQ